MTGNRERLAWVIVSLSFATCIALTVGIPLGTRLFIRTARANQMVTLEQQRGTPIIQRGGRGALEAVVGSINNILPESVITTDGASQVLLTTYAPDGELVAAVQIYNDTELVLHGARSPRFDASPLPHDVTVEVTKGRVRVSVNPADDRTTALNLHTPHADITLSSGSYEIRVYPTSTEVTVRDGVAQVTSTEQTLVLGASDRTIAWGGSAPMQLLNGERSLLQNGNFGQNAEGWNVYQLNVQQQPGPRFEATTYGGRTAARFQRAQGDIGHAEIGIRQEINYDVRDFSSLSLHLNVHILYQSLPGCGSLGSECPIMVRIDYRSVDGSDETWFQGFYSVPPGELDRLAEWNEQIPARTWIAFDSGNLIEQFVRPPDRIRTVTIYASGWGFDALVTEIELLAQE